MLDSVGSDWQAFRKQLLGSLKSSGTLDNLKVRAAAPPARGPRTPAASCAITFPTGRF